MTIQEMIAKATERQNAQIAAVAQLKQQRQEEARAAFRTRITEMFGSLVDELDMAVQSDSDYYSDSAHAMFGYESRIYRLKMGRDNWYLTRRDTRLSDDDRPLPCVEFSASYHNSMMTNQDAFVLALAELSQMPEPTMRTPQIDAPLAPRTCSEFEANLLDALRQFCRSEI